MSALFSSRSFGPIDGKRKPADDASTLLEWSKRDRAGRTIIQSVADPSTQDDVEESILPETTGQRARPSGEDGMANKRPEVAPKEASTENIFDRTFNDVQSMNRKGVMSRQPGVTPWQAPRITPEEQEKKWAMGLRNYKHRLDGLISRPGNQGELLKRESSGNPLNMNDRSYLGLYQYSTGRLQTLGVYTPAPNDRENSWQGTFHIPGFPK